MNARRTWLGIYSPDDRIKSETPHPPVPSEPAGHRRGDHNKPTSETGDPFPIGGVTRQCHRIRRMSG